MKNPKKLLALTLVLVLLLSVFTACGTMLNGTYRAEVMGNGTSYTFSGNKVTLNVSLLGAVVATLEGTYEINDGTITLTFSGDAEEEEEAKQYSGTFDFVMDDDGDTIKIGMVEYEKDGD